MKRNILLSLLASLLILIGCKDEFDQTLYGPDKTVAPVNKTDRTLIFFNTTGKENISSGSVVGEEPEKVIFSPILSIGESVEITTSIKLSEGKSFCEESFKVLPDLSDDLLQQYKEKFGYNVIFLPEDSYVVVNDLISIERDGREAINNGCIRIINSNSLELDQDYLLPLRLNAAEGFKLQKGNDLLYVHIKRKGGSGEIQGAIDLNPMKGDNVLDSEGVDRGINRNNLYYKVDGTPFKNLSKCTMEGLIYIDSFKNEEERSNGTLAGISSVWGYESGGDDVNFLLRFGDAGVNVNVLQLVVNRNKYIINYKFKEKKWYHIAVTFDGTNLKFYINFKERFSTTILEQISLAGNSLCIGQSFNQWRGFNGKMSEIRVWNTDRDVSELKANALDVLEYDLEKDKLIAYWKMNKVMSGSGNKMIQDVTGHGHNMKVYRQGASSSIEPFVVIDNSIDITIK